MMLITLDPLLRMNTLSEIVLGPWLHTAFWLAPQKAKLLREGCRLVVKNVHCIVSHCPTDVASVRATFFLHILSSAAVVDQAILCCKACIYYHQATQHLWFAHTTTAKSFTVVKGLVFGRICKLKGSLCCRKEDGQCMAVGVNYHRPQRSWSRRVPLD